MYWTNKNYFQLLLLLSGNISLNPGPIDSSQQYNNDLWVVFKKRGPHFVHININSLLPKIDELHYIAKLSEAAVIDISESKLDNSVLSSEFQIENYDLICSDRNRHCGGVACFLRNYLSYNTKSFLPSEIENIFIEIFLPHSKPHVVGTICHPLTQGSFTEAITKHFSKINTNNTEIYLLGDFNINLFSKQKYTFHQTNTQSMSHEVKNYFQLCSLYGLEQIIKSPTQVRCITSFLIDHILTTFPDREFHNKV